MTERSQLRVLVVSFTSIKSAPRALKQIRRLRGDYQVTSAGFGGAPVEGVSHVELDPDPPRPGFLRIRYVYPALLGLRRHRYVSRTRSDDAYQRLKGISWDIIIAHDLHTIALANRLQPRLGVLSDLHEYAPKQGEHSLLWRLIIAPHFRWLLRKEVSQAAEVTTVSQGIVDEYRREFGLDTELVTNATPFRSGEPLPVGDPIRLVHSGVPARQRRLDIIIEGVRRSTANVTLDLYLMETNPGDLLKLKKLAGDDPRINFCDPVPYAELLDVLARYDIGVHLIPPTSFNHEWCLPNKFFDFIQARLGVIIGPSPEMVRLVRQFGIGAVTDGFTPDALARLLDSLDAEKVAGWKRASHRAASELSAEEQVEVWARAVSRIADRNPK